MTIKTMNDVKAFNKEKGFYFFSKATMQFFNSRIETGLLHGGFFITSEQREVFTKRRYLIRKLNYQTGNINTILPHYDSKEDAKEALKKYKKDLTS